MHVKFEESNSLVKNVVETDSLGENFKKIFMIDLPAQEEDDKKEDDKKKKDNINGEDHNIEVEPTQPLPKDWRYAATHLKDFIVGDVSKGVITRSKLHNLCGHFAYISHIEHKNILEVEGDSYWSLAMKEELNQFECNQV